MYTYVYEQTVNNFLSFWHSLWYPNASLQAILLVVDIQTCVTSICVKYLHKKDKKINIPYTSSCLIYICVYYFVSSCKKCFFNNYISFTKCLLPANVHFLRFFFYFSVVCSVSVKNICSHSLTLTVSKFVQILPLLTIV